MLAFLYTQNRVGGKIPSTLKIIEPKNKLSGGQERRLDFARSLLANKEILLLDEVTSSLDKENRLRIEKLVDSLQEKMIICIAHEPSDTFISMFDEVITLEEGMLT